MSVGFLVLENSTLTRIFTDPDFSDFYAGWGRAAMYQFLIHCLPQLFHKNQDTNCAPPLLSQPVPARVAIVWPHA